MPCLRSNNPATSAWIGCELSSCSQQCQYQLCRLFLQHLGGERSVHLVLWKQLLVWEGRYNRICCSGLPPAVLVVAVGVTAPPRPPVLIVAVRVTASATQTRWRWSSSTRHTKPWDTPPSSKLYRTFTTIASLRPPPGGAAGGGLLPLLEQEEEEEVVVVVAAAAAAAVGLGIERNRQ